MVNHNSNQSSKIALPQFFAFYIYRIDYVAFTCLCLFNMILSNIVFNIFIGAFSLLSSTVCKYNCFSRNSTNTAFSDFSLNSFLMPMDLV